MKYCIDEVSIYCDYVLSNATPWLHI